MPSVFGAARRRAGSLRERVAVRLHGARARWRWFDHLVRAFDRYRGHHGDRLAAALTFYGFLSFFPLIALAFAVTGYAVAISPAVRDYVTKAIYDLLPGLANGLPVNQIAEAKAGAGVVGIAGLMWSGLGWIGAWRESLRALWTGAADDAGNVVAKRFSSLVVLCVLGITLLASTVLSGLVTSATHEVLRLVGLARAPGAGTLLRLVAVAIAVGANTLIFLVLFSRLSGTRAHWPRLLRGCLFGGIGFEVLKLAGTYLLAHVRRNPVYASFAVVVGLLVWINIVSRFILFVAAWTATETVVRRVDEPVADGA